MDHQNLDTVPDVAPVDKVPKNAAHANAAAAAHVDHPPSPVARSEDRLAGDTPDNTVNGADGSKNADETVILAGPPERRPATVAENYRDKAEVSQFSGFTAKGLKSILKKTDRIQPSGAGVQDDGPTGRPETISDFLASADEETIDTALESQKQIVQNLARRIQEDPPRYAIKAVYNEFLPCLQKINKHYHKIAVGATKDHPYLKDCDARLQWAQEYVAKTNDLI